MATFVGDCPRCGTKQTNFDCYSSIFRTITYGWMVKCEIFVVCRACHKSSIFVVSQTTSDGEITRMLQKTNGPVKLEVSLNDIFKFERIISQADENVRVPPEHLPENIHNVISEGNRCLSIGCWNAASAMYRLALDLATKEMLPKDGEPSSNIRKSLGLRIKWLFDHGRIADELRPLAECIQQDGNDGVHDGNLSEVDAHDLHDFSFEFLKKIYSDAKRVEIAKQRRLERRGSNSLP